MHLVARGLPISTASAKARKFLGPGPVLPLKDPHCPKWVKPVLTALKRDFRNTPESRHHQPDRPCQFRADIVAKVENWTTPKISRKQNFGRLRRCNTLWRRYEAPWPFF